MQSMVQAASALVPSLALHTDYDDSEDSEAAPADAAGVGERRPPPPDRRSAAERRADFSAAVGECYWKRPYLDCVTRQKDIVSAASSAWIGRGRWKGGRMAVGRAARRQTSLP